MIVIVAVIVIAAVIVAVHLNVIAAVIVIVTVHDSGAIGSFAIEAQAVTRSIK